MISHTAKDSFERIFFQAARTRLTTDAAHACDIVPVAAPGATDARARSEVFVLTIVSIDFRMLFVLQFADDDATRGYYTGHGGERTLREAAMEIGNLCCGAINQQLVEHFPDLGMSTPYALSNDCMSYLDDLKPSYVASYDITIENAARLRATMCIGAAVPLDFVAQEADMHESAGELELF